MSTKVNLNGRLTRDPELRYSPTGTAVVTFAVVTSRRVKDQHSGEWSDKDTTFWDCVAFNDLATNIAESLEKGTAVIVAGNAYSEEWEAKDGTKRRSLKVTVDDCAPSLRWASAKISRASRERPGDSKYDPHAKPADNPWASEPASPGFTDEAPF